MLFVFVFHAFAEGVTLGVSAGIEKGNLFSKITLDYQGDAPLPGRENCRFDHSFVSRRNGLKIGDMVYGMVKTNEVSIIGEADNCD